MDLHRTTPGGLSRADLRTSLLAADATAFALLDLARGQARAAAYGQGRSLNDVAADVVSGRLRFPLEGP